MFWLHFLFGTLMFLTALFLILLVLVQRGRGGGLAGALGGMGGQSAFGTKAGDTFTRITVGAAIFWILLCMASIKLLNDTIRKSHVTSPSALTSPDASGETGASTPKDKKADEPKDGAAGGAIGGAPGETGAATGSKDTSGTPTGETPKSGSEK